MDAKMKDQTKLKRDLATGLMAGMESENTTLEDRFRRADALLGGSAYGTYPTMPKDRPTRDRRSIRITFSMTKQDLHLIEEQLVRLMVETGVRLNKSELVRLGVIGLSKLTPEQLTELCQSLDRLNKRI